MEPAVITYLSFIGNEDFTLKTYNTNKNWDGTLEYSTNKSTWNTWDGTEISSAGNKLYLRGTGNTRITGGSNNFRFVFTGTSTLKIDCEGNIENLLDDIDKGMKELDDELTAQKKKKGKYFIELIVPIVHVQIAVGGAHSVFLSPRNEKMNKKSIKRKGK